MQHGHYNIPQNMLQYQIMAYKTFSGNPISNVSHFKIIIVSAGEHVNINEMKRLE